MPVILYETKQSRTRRLESSLAPVCEYHTCRKREYDTEWELKAGGGED